MTIDMHSHWRPSELMEALRQRTKEPRILVNSEGVEVLKSRVGEQPVGRAFDNVEQRLDEMDRGGISTAVLSLLGGFQWIERLPVEESLPLVRALQRQHLGTMPPLRRSFRGLCLPCRRPM